MAVKGVRRTRAVLKVRGFLRLVGFIITGQPARPLLLRQTLKESICSLQPFATCQTSPMARSYFGATLSGGSALCFTTSIRR